MPTPLVSVCIPTRNHERYIAAAIESALSESVDLEVVVVDDASDDDTALAARARDSRVRIERLDRRVGVAEARNACLRMARGRYVAWLDSDDAYLPGGLGRQVDVLEADRSVALVHGGFDVIGADGERLPDWAAPFSEDSVEPPEVAFRQLLASNEITTSTVVVRRATIDAAGGFHRKAGPSSSDWELWLRVSLRGGVAYTAERVAQYRQHAGTISQRAVASGQRLRCDLAVARRVLREEAALVSEPAALRALARAALAGKAVLRAGDLFTQRRRAAALRPVALAARLAPATLGRLPAQLAAATARGDAPACHRISRAMLGRLAERLEGTRYGAKLHRASSRDPEWELALRRIAGVVRDVVPPAASVGSVTKWDPTLLELSDRRGRNFPDRALLPDGYPKDGRAAVDHLESLRGQGLSHLVFPSASFWWLEHYAELAAHLDDRYGRIWADEDCVVYSLEPPA
jgi:hypothetical protein